MKKIIPSTLTAADNLRIKAEEMLNTRLAKGVVQSTEADLLKPVSYTHLTLPTNREV